MYAIEADTKDVTEVAKYVSGTGVFHSDYLVRTTGLLRLVATVSILVTKVTYQKPGERFFFWIPILADISRELIVKAMKHNPKV